MITVANRIYVAREYAEAFEQEQSGFEFERLLLLRNHLDFSRIIGPMKQGPCSSTYGCGDWARCLVLIIRVVSNPRACIFASNCW